MADEKIRNKSEKAENDLQDPIVDKLEDFMDRFSQIDVDEMVKGINKMVAGEEKDE